jgi:hypothetical protein
LFCFSILPLFITLSFWWLFYETLLFSFWTWSIIWYFERKMRLGIWSCFYPQFQNLGDLDPVRCFRQSLYQTRNLLNWGRRHQFVKLCVLVRLLTDGHNPDKPVGIDVKVWNVEQYLANGSPHVTETCPNSTKLRFPIICHPTSIFNEPVSSSEPAWPDCRPLYLRIISECSGFEPSCIGCI